MKSDRAKEREWKREKEWERVYMKESVMKRYEKLGKWNFPWKL